MKSSLSDAPAAARSWTWRSPAYKPDGSLADFGRGGIFTADFHGRGDFGQDLVIDSQNRIIAAGYTANGGDTEFALTRVFR